MYAMAALAITETVRVTPITGSRCKREAGDSSVMIGRGAGNPSIFWAGNKDDVLNH